MQPASPRQTHLARETGTLRKQGRHGVALVYPSPYPVGMSSLGFQTVYGRLNEISDVAAERAFLPESAGVPLLTYESGRPVSDFPIVAFSVAYELEVAGVLSCLKLAGLAPLASLRRERDPWVIAGGPLTFSNPLPLAPFVDVIVMGEAEELLAPLVNALTSGAPRREVLKGLAHHPGFFVPQEHGDVLPPIAKCDDALLPARSVVWTPDATLSNMFLIETSRGCSRGCTFCVMRRSTNGGMRIVAAERLLSLVPLAAPRVGLVGAAVSDHPHIVDIVRALVDRGHGIGLSSLRADKLTPDFVEALKRGGYRTLTVASDGASERLRGLIERKIREKHLLRAALLAAAHDIPQLKVYMMIGVPGETDADLDELISFSLKQADAAGPRTKIHLSIAPFVSKRNTPLAGLPFVGIREAERRLARLRAALLPRVQMRATSARWAWVEYMLAQGNAAAGLAVHEAWAQGGSFAAYRRALTPLLAPPAHAPARASA